MQILHSICALLQVARATSQVNFIRGVQPSKQSLYSKERFACLDGKGLGTLNDDYCDCEDNSDEPSTNACNDGLFYCQNIGHVATSIRSRLVDDGVCDSDCCDGSDEPSGLCPNVCKEKAVREAKEAEETERIRKLGAKAKLQLFQKAKDMHSQNKGKLADLEASLQDLKQKEKECDKKVKDTEGKSSLGFGEIVSSVVHKVIDAIGVGSGSTTKEPSLSSSPLPEQELCKEGGEGEESSCEDDDKKASHAAAIQAAKDEHREAKRKVEDAQNEIENLKKSFKTALSGNDEAYNALRDTCLEYKEGSYTYKFCWFNEIKQDYLLLGKFDKETWNVKDGRMRFENGQACWNGPIRHVIVQLVCSPEEKIISIAEPNMCEYFMQIGTSSFCEILPGDDSLEVDHSEL